MVFNATFNNISVISWSALLVEETGVPIENHQSAASHLQTLSHNVVSSIPRHERGFELTTLLAIGTDCIGSCKSIYHTITATSRPPYIHDIRKHFSTVILLTFECKDVSNTPHHVQNNLMHNFSGDWRWLRAIY